MYARGREHLFASRADGSSPPRKSSRQFLSWSAMKRDPADAEAVAAAQEQLRQITSELEGIRFRLLGVHASLAATLSKGGLAPTEPGYSETSAAIVSAVECVLIDQIGPALRSLQEAVQEEREEEGPAPVNEEVR